MFNATESGRETGNPIELYEFVWGDTDANVSRYTNHVEDITFDGNTFYSVPISRQAMETSGKTENKTLEISLDRSASIVSVFLEWPPMQTINVTIFGGHFTSGEFIALWSGRVMSAGLERNEVNLSCESTIISLQRPGLRRHYQTSCPYVLYGPYCQASFNAAQALVDVVNIAANGDVILPTDWWKNEARRPASRPPIPGPRVYVGGVVKWNSSYGKEERLIVDAGANRLAIMGSWREVTPGKQLQIALGCNHQLNHCKNLHDNALNFGGQPWIPLKNPVKQHQYW